ncbi:MAG: tRNA (guanine-N(2)-)-methyltransferase [Candidatus Parvarchaeum acidophilus ARMAN-5]|jgi:tRNA (guanine26-N2/guanine27-N2)-dimethyltransferase|uniref:tRNA (guanine(26)-N(2))-dimethyltransferase n=1 Tax=Candidatus Parvarchaeum acidophilus ARMAN-5 TaxID=662762 RepID=D6GUZ8_PARA5|nr:MAG: tRNA (guanine-N(2)-)-methyltransferase [Candidatus Parvarchaeum acidophilus ARMAN-5]
MELFKEGSIRFYAENQQLKSAHVFYNPNREFDRSLNVLFIKSKSKAMLSGLEMFSGSGIRGMRLCSETGMFKSFIFNDIKTSNIISKNISLNKSLLNCDSISVSAENSKYYKAHNIYDYIDIDPFGSPAPYLNTAFELLGKDSILAISATDTAALLGSAQRACMRKYMARSLKTSYSNELGIRILIKYVSEIAESHSLHIKPLIFDFNGNFIRTYFDFSSRTKGKVGYAYQCIKCPSRTIEPKDKCDFCGSKMTKIGPLWLGKIYDVNTVKKMLNYLDKNEKKFNQNTDALKEYLSALYKEMNVFSYYTTSEIASFFKRPEEKINKFKNRTVLSSKGFKTNLSFKELASNLGY